MRDLAKRLPPLCRSKRASRHLDFTGISGLLPDCRWLGIQSKVFEGCNGSGANCPSGGNSGEDNGQMRALDLFKGRHFNREIIVLCVRWYLGFKLSSRDLVQMMAERGIALTHTTILRWVQRYVPEFEKRWNKYSGAVGGHGVVMRPI
jgi:hypothetical protein